MILVDSAVWIDHFHRSNAVLAQLLDAREVLIHPFVIGEISMGSLRDRSMVLDSLGRLPKAVVAAPAEVAGFVTRNQLYGIGIGYVDAHLLAATMLTPASRLWTPDKRLSAVAARLAVAFEPAATR